MPNTERDAIYGRESNEQAEREQRIDVQLRNIRDRFGPEGRPVYKEYLDNPFPGTTMVRPGLDSCLADARKGCFNRLLVDHPDRLSRGEPWMLPYIEWQLEQAGVEVCYASYNRQRDAMGNLLHTVVAAVAHIEHGNIKRHMSSGIASKLERGGVWRSRRPFGWKYEPPTGKEKDGRLVLVPEEAVIAREIFDRVLAGETTYAIAGLLNERGIRTTVGKYWRPDAVGRIIHNPLYSGRPTTNRRESMRATKPRDRYTAERELSSRPRPREEWRHAELPDRIVSPEEQERAIAQLASNQKRAKRNAKHDFLLSGLVYCGHELPYEPGVSCGRKMEGHTNASGTRFYRCTRKKRHDPRMPATCKGHMHADELEAKVWGKLVEAATRPEILEGVLDLSIARLREQSAHLPAALAEAHRTRDQHQARLDTLLEWRLAGDVDKATFERKQAELVALRDQAAAQIAYLEGELATLAEAERNKVHVKRAFLQVGRTLDVLLHSDNPATFAGRQHLLHQMVEAVTLHADGSISLHGLLQEVEEAPTSEIVPHILR